MAINYNDSRFKAVEEEKQQALASANNMYNNMIENSDSYYNDMKTAAENYGNQQAEIQQANTDFAISKIEQAKDEAAKSYTKEQKGAYVDWQKQSNQYGVEAEQRAMNGMSNTGYSESSQVAMYTAYQNRLGQARETYNKAVQEYDNGITQARLANNAALAEIAYKALQTSLELGLNQFQYKNNLLKEQLATQTSLDNMYYGRRQDVLSQINAENALAEQQRQFNAEMAYKNSVKNGGGGGGNGGYHIDKNGNILDANNNPVTASEVMQTEAGRNALNYLTNFVSGDANNSKNLTKLDRQNIEKYIGEQVKKGMTPEEAQIIDNYYSTNFTQNKKFYESIADIFKGA